MINTERFILPHPKTGCLIEIHWAQEITDSLKLWPEILSLSGPVLQALKLSLKSYLKKDCKVERQEREASRQTNIGKLNGKPSALPAACKHCTVSAGKQLALLSPRRCLQGWSCSCSVPSYGHTSCFPSRLCSAVLRGKRRGSLCLFLSSYFYFSFPEKRNMGREY